MVDGITVLWRGACVLNPEFSHSVRVCFVSDNVSFRPKISGPGEPAADFDVRGPEEHGVFGLVHMFGIESPGLTSSLALAEVVVAKLDCAP